MAESAKERLRARLIELKKEKPISQVKEEAIEKASTEDEISAADLDAPRTLGEGYVRGFGGPLGDPALAGIEAGYDTLQKIQRGIDPDIAEDYFTAGKGLQERRKEHPIASTAGEVGGMLNPYGVLGKVSRVTTPAKEAGLIERGLLGATEGLAQEGSMQAGKIASTGEASLEDAEQIQSTTMLGGALGGGLKLLGMGGQAGLNSSVGRWMLAKAANVSTDFVDDFMASGRKILAAKDEKELAEMLGPVVAKGTKLGQEALDHLAVTMNRNAIRAKMVKKELRETAVRKLQKNGTNISLGDVLNDFNRMVGDDIDVQQYYMNPGKTQLSGEKFIDNAFSRLQESVPGEKLIQSPATELTPSVLGLISPQQAYNALAEIRRVRELHRYEPGIVRNEAVRAATFLERSIIKNLKAMDPDYKAFMEGDYRRSVRVLDELIDNFGTYDNATKSINKYSKQIRTNPTTLFNLIEGRQASELSKLAKKTITFTDADGVPQTVGFSDWMVELPKKFKGGKMKEEAFKDYEKNLNIWTALRATGLGNPQKKIAAAAKAKARGDIPYEYVMRTLDHLNKYGDYPDDFREMVEWLGNKKVFDNIGKGQRSTASMLNDIYWLTAGASGGYATSQNAAGAIGVVGVMLGARMFGKDFLKMAAGIKGVPTISKLGKLGLDDSFTEKARRGFIDFYTSIDDERFAVVDKEMYEDLKKMAEKMPIGEKASFLSDMRKNNSIPKKYFMEYATVDWDNENYNFKEE